MDELNKTAATEPETRPEAAKLQDAPRRRVGSLTLGACLIAAGIFFLCYYFVLSHTATLSTPVPRYTLTSFFPFFPGIERI